MHVHLATLFHNFLVRQCRLEARWRRKRYFRVKPFGPWGAQPFVYEAHSRALSGEACHGLELCTAISRNLNWNVVLVENCVPLNIFYVTRSAYYYNMSVHENRHSFQLFVLQLIINVLAFLAR